MSKRKIDKTMPARRSIPAIALRNFRSTRFDHKTEARGGSTNSLAEILAEVEEVLDLDDDDCEW